MGEYRERGADATENEIAAQKVKVDVERNVYFASPQFQPEFVEHFTVKDNTEQGHQSWK